jgi:hypothetical protein
MLTIVMVLSLFQGMTPVFAESSDFVTLAAPDSISVAPDAVSVRVGGTQQFTATVTGGDPSADIVWSVVGNTDPATAVSEGGLLTVSGIEGAKALIVVAASGEDPTVFASAAVTVADLPFSTDLSRNDLVLHYIFDADDKGPNNNIVKDYSPRGNDAVIDGNPTASQWSADGFTFGGQGAPNSIKIPASANLVNPRMTIVFGLTRTGTQSGSGSLFSGKSGWSSNGFWMNTNNCYISHNGTASTTLGAYTTVFPTNQRREFAYSADARTADATGVVMMNGVKSATNVAGGAITRLANLAHYSIGLNTWGDEQLVNARFDKYMIFNRDLTEAELLEVYQGRLDPHKAELNDEILSALGRNETYYTEASMNALRSARRAAVNVLKDRTASDETIGLAVAELRLAVRSLATVPDIVRSVTVTPETATVNLTGSQQFAVDVQTGDASIPKTVEWSVNSEKSAVTQDGLLTVSAAETATALTVKATSTVDYAVYGAATVTVTFDPVVVSVDVSPKTVNVMKGTTAFFEAELNTVGGASEAVVWSVNSEKSSINAEGVLSVAADETASSLTVTATSVFDGTKSVAATANLYEITGVTITPPSANPQKGRLSLFTATVNGTGVPEDARGVVWTVTGATSAQTIVNAFGGLAVGADETASTLTLKAASIKNPAKFAELAVTVEEYREEKLIPNNSYYNSVRRAANTAENLYGSASVYANNAVIADWESSGVWRTITGQTAPNVMSTNTGLTWSISQVGAPSSAGTLYPAGEGIYLGDWSTYYRFTGGAGLGSDMVTYAGGATNSNFADVDYSVGMRLVSGAGAVVFRFRDALNYYYVKATVGEGYRLGKVENGVDTVLRTATTGVRANTWYNLRVQVAGNTVKVTRHGYAYWTIRSGAPSATIFDNVTLDADAPFKQGRVGLWAPDGNTDAQFNLIRIGNHDFNYKLENDTFAIASGSQGQLKSLKVKDGTYADIEFMGNEDNNQLEMGLNKYLGELKFKYSVAGGADRTANTGASEDIREMAYDTDAGKISVDYSTGASENATGIRDFAVSESYSLGTDPEVGDYVQLDINLKNTNAQSIEFKDIALPITWNNHWQADSAYENYATHASNYVSYHGSYISVERASGGGDKLVLIPNAATDTSLEYRRFASTQDYYMNMPEEFFIHSKGIAAQTANNWNQGYLPNTSLTLAAGEDKTFSFRIFKTSDYLGINDILVDQGSVAPVVEPGMVVPQNAGATVDLRTIKNIESVEDTTPAAPAPYVFDPAHRATITKDAARSDGEHHIYDIQFNKLGRCDVTVTYDGGKKTVLQFWVTEDLQDAIQRRADFIVDELFIDEARQAEIMAANASTSNLYKLVDKHLYGFLEFNNVTGSAGLHSGNSHFCTLSDYEQYFDAPVFLAAKNVYYPVQREIDALDKNLIDLVYAKQYNASGTNQGYLCVHCCNQNTGWTFGSIDRVGRWMTYPTVYNAFFHMYQVAKRYPDMDTRWEAKQYLEVAAWLAYRVAQNSGTTGMMGEQTVYDILTAAEAEGLTSVAANLRSRSVAKGNNVAAQSYPFGSEFAFDNTGEEGSYFNIKHFSASANKTAKMQQVADKSLAWIGKTPVWYLQTTGRPMGNDWWMFQYSVGMQAKAYQDWFFNYADENVDDYYGEGQYSQDIWRMIYPAKMSPFIHILSGQPEFNVGPTSGNLANADQTVSGRGVKGSVWGNYMPTRPYNWNIGFPYSTSAESDLSLWSGLQILSMDIVPNDPAFGLTGYGGEVTDGGDSYDVIPTDGLYRRLNVVGDRFQMELINDQYTAASIDKDYKSVSVELKNVTGGAHEGEISLRGLTPGTYNVRVDGMLLGTADVTDGDAKTNFAYTLDANTATLLIVEEDEDDTVDTDRIVNVSVEPATTYAAKGGTAAFTPNVKMINNESHFTGAVTWSVAGGASADTKIGTDGILTVGADETATALTVKATSQDDPTKSGEASVTLYVIHEVVIAQPDVSVVTKGKSLRFTASVSQENAPSSLRGVIWSVEDNEDIGTFIDETGLLSVYAGETATEVTVKATSAGDPSKTDTFVIALADRAPISLSDLKLYYRFDGSAETGGALKDYSESGYNAVIAGTVNDASWPGEGFAFNGTNYIDLPNDADLISPEMTFVFRIKRTGDMGVGNIFWSKNSSDYAGNGMWVNTNTGLFVSHDGFSANFELGGVVNDVFPLNEWVEVGYAIDTTGAGAKGLLMINGQPVSTAIPEAATLTDASSPQNSVGAAGYDFNERLNHATMGRFLIFDRALTATELIELYNGELPALESADIFSLRLTVELDGEAVNEEDVTGETWAAFETALANAKAIIANPGNYFQPNADAALQAFTDAYDAARDPVNQVSTLLLKVYIEEAESILANPGQYVTSVITKVTVALADAKTVLATRESQAAIDAAEAAMGSVIETAYESADAEDMAEVARLAAFARTLTQADFTDESWEKLDKALKIADKVMEEALENEADVYECEYAFSELDKALKGLVVKVALKYGALDTAIAKAKAIVAAADKYVASTIANLSAALTVAETARANAATQIALDQAAVDLAKLIAKARVKADLSALQQILAILGAFDFAPYADAEVAYLKDLIGKARLLTEDADQSLVDRMVADLNAGLNALRAKSGIGAPPAPMRAGARSSAPAVPQTPPESEAPDIAEAVDEVLGAESPVVEAELGENVIPQAAGEKKAAFPFGIALIIAALAILAVCLAVFLRRRGRSEKA